jgi:hypothetical protein
MSKRVILKALLAGGLTTLATAALTVHAATAPQFALTAIDVLQITPVDQHALPLTALPPGQRVVVINGMRRPLQIKGYAHTA